MFQAIPSRCVACQCQDKKEVAEVQVVKNLQQQKDEKSDDIMKIWNARLAMKTDRIERTDRSVLGATYAGYKLFKKKSQFSVKKREKPEVQFKSVSTKFKNAKQIVTKLRIEKINYEKTTKQEILKLKRDVAGYESARQEIKKLKSDLADYERTKRLVAKLQTDRANYWKLKSEMSQLQASLKAAKEMRQLYEQEVEKSELKYRKLRIKFEENSSKLFSTEDKLCYAEMHLCVQKQAYEDLLNDHLEASRELFEMEQIKKSLKQKSQLLSEASAKVKKLQQLVDNYKRNCRHDIVFTNDQQKQGEQKDKYIKQRKIIEETTYTVGPNDAYMIPVSTRIIEEVEESDDEEQITGVLTQHDLNEPDRLEAKSEKLREEKKKWKELPKPSEEQQIIACVNKTVKEYEESLKKKDDDESEDEGELSFFRLKPKKKKLNMQNP